MFLTHAAGWFLTILLGWPGHPLDQLARDARRAQLDPATSVYRPSTSADLPPRARLQLERAAACDGLAVIDTAFSDPALTGMLRREEQAIYLSAALAPDARVQVLAHEIAHAHHPAGWTASEGEVFADGVSYLYGLAAGARGWRPIYAAYLSQYKQALPILSLYRAEIERTVAELARGAGCGATDGADGPR